MRKAVIGHSAHHATLAALFSAERAAATFEAPKHGPGVKRHARASAGPVPTSMKREDYPSRQVWRAVCRLIGKGTGNG